MRIDPVTNPPDPSTEKIFSIAGRNGHVPALYGALAHAPRMLEAWTRLAWPLRGSATTSRGLRELVILRVAHKRGAVYAAHHHAEMAAEAGVEAPKIAAVQEDLKPAVFTPLELAALRFADEMTINKGPTSADSVARLRQYCSDAEFVEILLTIAFYICVAAVNNALDLRPDDDLPWPIPPHNDLGES